MSYAAHFSQFLTSDPQRIHAAAHSHHPWPDVSFEAHRQAWLDAAHMHDDKWDHVFGVVIPQAQRFVARRLRLPDAATIAFAPNTHELVSRVVSGLPSPARVLTTDGEFHSFTRQLARWEEAGRAAVQRVPTAPLETFVERFAAAAAKGGHDLVFCSHVVFDSGFVVADIADVVRAVADERTVVIVDGYHGFMALPTDFSELADRAFYVAGGYKYAMAGEGACFLHAPPGYEPRPLDTGWLAEFADLERRPGQQVGFAGDGSRFLGATFDPSGLYRLVAVQRWIDDLGLDVAEIHAHVGALLAQLENGLAGVLPPAEASPHGHFISVRLNEAAVIHRRLRAAGVVTDVRGDRLRSGLGLYHDSDMVDELLDRIRSAVKR